MNVVPGVPRVSDTVAGGGVIRASVSATTVTVDAVSENAQLVPRNMYINRIAEISIFILHSFGIPQATSMTSAPRSRGFAT